MRIVFAESNPPSKPWEQHALLVALGWILYLGVSWISKILLKTEEPNEQGANLKHSEPFDSNKNPSIQLSLSLMP